MKREQWSGYEKFIIMMDKSSAVGIKRDYNAYMDYTILLSVLENVRKGQQPDSYYHDGKVIDLGLRKTQMDKFTDKLERGMWSEQLRVPANKLNLGNLIAPIGSGKWVPSESSNLD